MIIKSIELSYYWATIINRKIYFYNKIFNCWFLNNKLLFLLIEIYCIIQNIFDWLFLEMQKYIKINFLFLEELDNLKKITILKKIAESFLLELIIPPNSQPGVNAKLKY